MFVRAWASGSCTPRARERHQPSWEGEEQPLELQTHLLAALAVLAEMVAPILPTPCSPSCKDSRKRGVWTSPTQRRNTRLGQLERSPSAGWQSSGRLSGSGQRASTPPLPPQSPAGSSERQDHFQLAQEVSKRGCLCFYLRCGPSPDYL